MNQTGCGGREHTLAMILIERCWLIACSHRTARSPLSDHVLWYMRVLSEYMRVLGEYMRELSEYMHDCD